jgi:hypothetical protein
MGMAPSAKFTLLSAHLTKGFSGTKTTHSAGVASVLTCGKVPLDAPLRWEEESRAVGYCRFRLWATPLMIATSSASVKTVSGNPVAADPPEEVGEGDAGDADGDASDGVGLVVVLPGEQPAIASRAATAHAHSLLLSLPILNPQPFSAPPADMFGLLCRAKAMMPGIYGLGYLGLKQSPILHRKNPSASGGIEGYSVRRRIFTAAEFRSRIRGGRTHDSRQRKSQRHGQS